MKTRRWAPGRVAYTMLVAPAVVAGILVGSITPAHAIVGGEQTAQYSWLVAFVSDGTNEVYKRVVCSGSLLKPQWVITNAHCPLPSATTTVVVGRSDLANSNQGQKRDIIQHIYQPDYDPNGIEWLQPDLKLIKLDSSVSLADMDLAGPGEVNDWGMDQPARTYGYGWSTINGPYASQFSRRAEFEITEMWANHIHYVAVYTGRTACRGDSGGPSIVSTPSGPKQAGVHFASPKDSNGNCILGSANHFVKVGYRGATNSPMWDWIISEI